MNRDAEPETTTETTSKTFTAANSDDKAAGNPQYAIRAEDQKRTGRKSCTD